MSEDESLRKILSSQPDFTAIQRFVFSEGFGGFGAKSKVVKMGNLSAEITEETIFINEPGKPTIKVFPKRKEYAEVQSEKEGGFPVSPEDLARSSDTIFKSLGTEKVGDYACTKIEVSYKDEKLREMRFIFWAAPALKNLVIRSETSLGPRVRFLSLLEDVSLSVDKEVFRVPAGYKKVVEPNNMKQLENNVRKPINP